MRPPKPVSALVRPNIGSRWLSDPVRFGRVWPGLVWSSPCEHGCNMIQIKYQSGADDETSCEQSRSLVNLILSLSRSVSLV